MKRRRWMILLLGMVLSVGAYFLVVTPDNTLWARLRGRITQHDAKVIIGPYPVEKDFQNLKKQGVTTVISLLDPQLPYERTLLDREQALGRSFGMQILNFPMISIWGKRFGATYERNAAAAADAAVQASGPVYLHCYLGLHRVKSVADLLQQRVTTGTYLVREAERSTQARLLDQAQAQFEAGQYASARLTLEKIRRPEPPAQLLLAWSHYHLSTTATARSLFTQLLKDIPENREARTGLGYCALRDNDLPAADRYFAQVRDEDPKDPAVRTGLGLVYYRQGRLEDAAAQLQEALRLNPSNNEAREVLARIAAATKTKKSGS